MQPLMTYALAISIFMLSFASAAMTDNLTQLEIDAKALELFLQDKKDHKENCSHIDWEQPPLSTYKKTLNSHLPDGCKQ